MRKIKAATGRYIMRVIMKNVQPNQNVTKKKTTYAANQN